MSALSNTYIPLPLQGMYVYVGTFALYYITTQYPLLTLSDAHKGASHREAQRIICRCLTNGKSGCDTKCHLS